MVLSDAFATLGGVLIGTLAFLPFALVIAASAVRSEARYLWDLRRPDVTNVTIEPPSRDIVLFEELLISHDD